ncbi:hypothetical protein SO694_000890117 [Aureococcus anophagefferens]|uniref:Uncharacterized protein n=1 Tax=Aureococcus anophagefferens TaxID=44056 RepID=A0ABR1FJ20_AURAN
MGADETQEEQIARHLAGDVHDSDVASDADSSSDDDDDDASTSSVEVLSNANGAVPTATAVRFRRRNPKRPNTQSHARYEKYNARRRRELLRLHHPPPAHFAEIGLAAYDLVAAPGGVSLAALDACYRGFDRIGPTMSKVLLVTNHLWRPHLNILGDDCEVGDGADEAFSFLYGARGGGDAARKRRLRHLSATTGFARRFGARR